MLGHRTKHVHSKYGLWYLAHIVYLLRIDNLPSQFSVESQSAAYVEFTSAGMMLSKVFSTWLLGCLMTTVPYTESSMRSVLWLESFLSKILSMLLPWFGDVNYCNSKRICSASLPSRFIQGTGLSLPLIYSILAPEWDPWHGMCV